MQAINQEISFEIISKQTVCSGQLATYRITEGLYLFVKLGSNNNLQLVRSYTQVKTPISLLLAENDNSKLHIAEIYKEMNLRTCFLFTNFLSIYIRRSDKFFEILDQSNNKLIIYASHGEISKK